MIIGNYEILETIGHGGMGIVYRARHRETGQVVAIKAMTEDAASNWVLCQRFQQEHSAANRLRHPNIVRGLGFGTDNGRPFLVMELVEGQNLGERIKQRGPLAENEVVGIAVQIAGALELAHQHGLIHRDVKPENILLAKDGQAKLADLGLVKDLTAVGAELTGDGTGLGTIAYVAPEQYENARNADPRCDIYSLAASLYHALTGVAPFQGPTNLAILKKKLGNDFVSPRRIVRSLSRRVEALLCRALDCRPQKRPSSCAEMIAALLEPSSGADPAGSGPLGRLGLGAEREGEPVLERRKACRFPTNLKAWCHPWDDADHPFRAEIQDLSRTGAQLHMDRRFEAGALLAVTVLDRSSKAGPYFWVEVRWARKLSGKKWAIGVAFQGDLTPGELETMLGDVPATEVVAQP
jgi:serine/threonine protein kinase